MLLKKILPLLLSIILLESCTSTKQISYFQDIQSEKSIEKITALGEIRIRAKDKVSILVNSKDPLLADLFNLPVVSRQVGSITSTTYNQGISGYTVNSDGNIDFPVLGEIHIEGMTREEASAHIKNELISKNLIKDPIITVEFMNLTISILGEVNRPGRYNIDKDKITLLDALSLAGDLTIYGKRERVLVLREQNGHSSFYEVNLCSIEQLYSSPAYYLQQNDIVYVDPNSTRAFQSTVNGNTIRSTSFWISLASLLTSIGILVFN